MTDRDLKPSPHNTRAKKKRAQALRRERARRQRRKRAIQEHLVTGNNRTVPRKFDPLMAEKICARYADGEPMLSILATAGYPSGGEFYLWVEQVPETQRMWEAARRARAHAISEETLSLADLSLKGHPAYIPARSLQVKTRQWLASKLRPDTYGEHVNMKHDGTLSLAAMSKSLRTVEPPELALEGKVIDDEPK